jgi:hypothetical protein
VINGGSPIAVNSCPDNDHLTLASTGGSLTTSTWYNDSTIAVTNGSATVVGTRTGFIDLFGPCNGTTWIAIKGTTNPDNGIYKVTGCPDNTHLTINAVYGSTTQGTVANYALSKQSLSSCSPSISTTCEPIFGGGKGLSADWSVSLGQTYQWTMSSLWKDRLGYALGSNYGGPSGGPSSLGANSGPQATLGPDNFDEPLYPCNGVGYIQPCAIGGGGGAFDFGHSAKAFGMSAGAGNSRQAIADYLIQVGIIHSISGQVTISGMAPIP